VRSWFECPRPRLRPVFGWSTWAVLALPDLMAGGGSGRPTAVSLFTGCGGSDAGLIEAGFDIVLANDICRYAREFYLANLPETDYKLADITTLSSFPEADLLVGCYPCQGFSEGGVRKANRGINYLYQQFDRVLRLIRPKAFIVENVQGLTRSNFRHLLNNQIIRFRLARYRVQTRLLNAADYGVPQERRRVFLVGIRSDIDAQYEFPEATHGSGEGQHPYVTIRDAIEGLPDWPEGEYCDDPFHWYYMSRNRRRGWDELSKTIVSTARHMLLHPISPTLSRVGPDCWEWTTDEPRRRFSFREASALQGLSAEAVFPDTDRMHSETAGLRMKYRVVGNAVPPPLFRAVAGTLPEIW